MGYINVDPITRKVKEYKNIAEWQADVEKATADPKPKPIKKMSFAEASKKLREEAGIDLRDSTEKRQAEVDSLIEQKVAEGISAALARQQQQQATQSPPSKQVQHHATKSRCSCHIASQSPTGDCHHQKHSRAGEAVTHSKERKVAADAVGPVMPCQKLTLPLDKKRLREAGVEI